MDNPRVPLVDRRRMFLYAYSNRAFEHVAELADFIMQHPEYIQSPISHSLATALVVPYARPFGKWKIAKGVERMTLPLDTVPEAGMALHEKTIALRDQVFAHQDFDIRELARGAGSAVGLESKSEKIHFLLRELDLKAIPVKGLCELSRELVERTDKVLDDLIDQYGVMSISIPNGKTRLIDLGLDGDRGLLFSP
jgi:hypothetical protein